MRQRVPETVRREGCAWLAARLAPVIEETLHICRIPAPTFAEAERAAYVAARMRAIGLEDVRLDAIHNVTGMLPGQGPGPTVLVVAHLDTVFAATTPLEVRRTQRRLYGPGIGDNSVAVAALLHVAEALRRLPSLPGGRLLFAGSVGEEGLGNLRGMHALLEAWDGALDAVIAVEGHGLDEVRTTAIGSTRLEVTFEGKGGHSWSAFGTPSAIHAMGQAIDALSRLAVPSDPKTTYNVGLVEGGESVNTIAARARMVVDLRSVDPAQLRRLETQVAQLLRQVARTSGVRVRSRIVGQRPAAALDPAHPLLQRLGAVRRHLGLPPATFSAGSTDANLPLSRGIPALCLGITRGGRAHTVHEFIELAPLPAGLQQLFLFLLAILETEGAPA
ncbi:MAG: peptidase M20 [Candidatus Tectimicrobiota bacterium]|nr:MAG: peptidase M20 [Candidatus Tectomicrobia bacterium]